MAKKVRCKCGYEWTTNSILIYVTCPSCQKKVKISKEDKELSKKEVETLKNDLATRRSPRFVTIGGKNGNRN